MKKRSVKNAKLVSGFTLVELLVVISIIAVLLAVMMPALNKAKEGARSVVCKSNQKQIVLAASLWSQDHDGYVVSGMWYVPAKPYENDSSNEAALAVEAIQRGSSLEKYTGSDQSKKNSLYSCPTAAKFGNSLFSLSSGYFSQSGVTRIGAASYGVNGLAVFYNSTQWLGVKGTPGGSEASYAGWGPSNTYMVEHGNSKTLQIPRPSTKVYFSDFSFPTMFPGDEAPHIYDPLKVVCRSGEGDSIGRYTTFDSLELAKGKGDIVQARWHGTVISKKTGYGYGNIAWFDGSVSKEPSGFDNTKRLSGGTTTARYAWHKYFQNDGL